MIKKLFVFLIIIVISFGFSFPAYAEDVDVSTSDKYLDAVWGEIYSYANGNMSFDEFNQRVDSLTESYINSNTIDGKLGYGVNNLATKVTALTAKVGTLASQFGEGCIEYIQDFFENFMKDYEVLREEPTTDLKGYGACVYLYNKNNPKQYTYYYADYFTIWFTSGHDEIFWASALGSVIHSVGVDEYGNKIENDTVYNGSNNGFAMLNFFGYRLYGDIRYQSGEQAPTDDEYVEVKDYDLNDLPYNELNDLLDRMIEELNRQQPDLSSIEGILQAIYYQCTGINDKMLTYSQCNSLIMSLMASGDKNTEQIVSALYEIRDKLKDDEKGDSGGEDTGGEYPNKKEIAGTLYNVKPLDKNFLQNLVTDKQNLRVEYEGKTYYLEDDGTLLLDGKYYYVDMNYDGIYDVDIDFKNTDIYTNFDFTSLTTAQKEKLDNIVESLYGFMSQLIPYTSITSIIPLAQSIIFNTSEPQDIIFKFNATDDIQGFEATILSVSFLKNEYVQKALVIVKPFLVIVIGYSWLLLMRKKAVSMIGG